jgi:hypothetical protein
MLDFHKAMMDWPTLVEDIKGVLNEQDDPLQWKRFRCWVSLDGGGNVLFDEAEMRKDDDV